MTIAGVPSTNTTTDEVLVRLRKLVIVADALAEAEVEFTMRPRDFLRRRLYEVPTRTGKYGIPITESSRVATFEVDFQERQHSDLVLGEELQDVVIIIQAGTVILVPALTDVDTTEVPT